MNNEYGLDIETNSLNLFSKYTKLLSMSIGSKFYIPYVPNSKLDYTLPIFKEILEDKNSTIIGHNLTFDITGVRRFFPEIDIQCKLFDTMVANYLTSFSFKGKNNLSTVSKRYLQVDKIDLPPKDIPRVEREKLLTYNHVDTALVSFLYPILLEELKLNGTYTLFLWLMKILDVLIKVQTRGVNLDVEYLEEHQEEVQREIEILEKELKEFFGDINTNSHKQLSHFMFEELKLPILKKSKKTKKPSTDEETITLLSRDERVPEEIKKSLLSLLDLRALKKHNGTYVIPLLNDHLGIDNKVHTNYYLGQGYGIDKKRFGTVSGRTSSSNPNLQNISNTRKIRGISLNIRKSFIPGKGKRLFKADYSQLEMRVAGYLAEDEVLFGVFRDEIDIHTYTMANIFDVSYDWAIEQLEAGDKEWKKNRRLIKTFNFALIYGGSDWKLKKILWQELGIDMSIHEVRNIMNTWDRLYRKFTIWKNKVHSSIYHFGYVKSITGRERFFFNPEEETPEPKKMQSYQREGLNHCIQSFAGEIALLGLYFMENDFVGDPLLFVHDSIDGEYEIGVQSHSEMERSIKECMIHKPKEVLMDDFKLENISNLYLDVDTEFNLENWK